MCNYNNTIDDVTQWRKRSKPISGDGVAYGITPTAAVKGLKTAQDKFPE